MNIGIRRFEEADIVKKVEWINDPLNNAFLHYDLPLEYNKTLSWYKAIKDRADRYDATIEVDGLPVGIIGLLNIDQKNKKAEYYITLGDRRYIGKGVANNATRQLLSYAFDVLGLNRIYLYTETKNHNAQRLFERIGFIKESIQHQDLFCRGKYIDRYIYAITKQQFIKNCFSLSESTPIQDLGFFCGNSISVKRDDLLSFSFGGNKARKAQLFFQEIDSGDYDTVVTYGSGSSNHCRIVANMAAQRGMDCLVISPDETLKSTSNSDMLRIFKTQVITCPVADVSQTIEKTMNFLGSEGKRPYFIPGGGHGNIGTQAYVNCYKEILLYESANGIKFDYIFHASGTGTTQAGLVAGRIMHQDDRQIVGISIARKNPRGRNVVVASVHDYLAEKHFPVTEAELENSVIFTDDYISGGYGEYTPEIAVCIRNVLIHSGIPLDTTYTGKAFWGMQEYLKKNDISGKNILFIHTGGTPIFFDSLRDI